MDSITQQYVQELDEVKGMLRLTDKQLAAEIGVMPSMLSNWRTGKSGISAKCQSRIIQFYLRIDWQAVEKQMPGSAIKKETPPTPPPAPDKLLQYVVEEWGSLSAETRGQIILLIEADKERKNTPPDIQAVAE